MQAMRQRHRIMAASLGAWALVAIASCEEGSVTGTSPQPTPTTTATTLPLLIQQILDTGVCFNCSLQGANLSGLSLDRVNLSGSDLRNADLRQASLQASVLRLVNLQNADLRQANLLTANLIQADLRSADLTTANLQNASLEGANLRDATLIGTILGGATYSLSTTFPIGFNPNAAGMIFTDILPPTPPPIGRGPLRASAQRPLCMPRYQRPAKRLPGAAEDRRRGLLRAARDHARRRARPL
ncbi:MAG: pentapeptide repeat-containing protein [Synechococcaceae cyanobacterium SM2_3_60]|nr:pentapeptide repeat-containing protein [Synechococcaceae cyanobacterium SM2_3_60]